MQHDDNGEPEPGGSRPPEPNDDTISLGKSQPGDGDASADAGQPGEPPGYGQPGY
jgi:hypothetical protein